jgi:hypothetical protein
LVTVVVLFALELSVIVKVTTICSTWLVPSPCPEKKLQLDTFGWNFDSALFCPSAWALPTFHDHR